MIRINLLPFRAARKKENIRRQISYFILTIFLIVAIMGFFNIRLNKRVETLDTDVRNSRAELVSYQKKAREVDSIKKQLSNLKTKMEIMESLEYSRKEPVRLLSAMSDMIIPKRMWFESLTDQGDRLKINGIAFDNKTVADFMTNLEKSPIFSSVNLQTLKLSSIKKSMDLKSFEIICTKAPQKIAKDEGEQK